MTVVKKHLLVLLPGLLVGCDAFSSPEATPPLSEDAVLSHLNFLADDSLYGRGSGTAYELEAAEYIRDEFIAYGLTPGVTGYLQEFTYVTEPSPQTVSGMGDGLDIGSGSVVDWSEIRIGENSALVQETQSNSQNVIGVLNGRGDLAGQWVVLGAHYDHIGFQQVADDSIVIFNGADDNASGVSVLLEVARYLQHYLTDGIARKLGHRSIMFHAYGAEEVGLHGSTYFVENPTVPMDSITAMVNLDMVGRMSSDVLIVLASATSLLWEPLYTERNDAGLVLEFPQRVTGRSDHYPFYLANIPVTHLYTGTHRQYHDADDDVWRLNTGGMVKIGDLVVASMLDLVVRSETPSFVP